MRKVRDTGVASWGDRAFRFDINGDGNAEYFVPLECGATGNCSWGVFTTKPNRLVGIVDGEDIYVLKSKTGWSEIETYIHDSASDGYVRRYGIRQGRYTRISKDKFVSAYLNNFPKWLDKVHFTCDPGYRPTKRE